MIRGEGRQSGGELNPNAALRPIHQDQRMSRQAARAICAFEVIMLLILTGEMVSPQRP